MCSVLPKPNASWDGKPRQISIPESPKHGAGFRDSARVCDKLVSTISYPKVLFITPCAFNQLTGGGITFSNLFRGWPKDRIATIHRDSVPVSTDVCSRYYKLNWKELTPALPLTAGVINIGTLTHSLEAWVRAFAPDVIYTILGT